MPKQQEGRPILGVESGFDRRRELVCKYIQSMRVGKRIRAGVQRFFSDRFKLLGAAGPIFEETSGVRISVGGKEVLRSWRMRQWNVREEGHKRAWDAEQFPANLVLTRRLNPDSSDEDVPFSGIGL